MSEQEQTKVSEQKQRKTPSRSLFPVGPRPEKTVRDRATRPEEQKDNSGKWVY